MRHALLTFALLALVAGAEPGRAAEAAAKKAEAAKQVSAVQPFLGVAVEPLPAALASQVPAFHKGQGILVAQVAKESPAAKAGLQANDVLLSYGDHKLSSPEELVKHVRHDKPGHEVTLRFLRGGKAESCNVTLGERAPGETRERTRVFRLLPGERLREMFEETESGHDSSAWESFDALKLTRLDGKRWRAEIQYRSKDGQKEHKSFEGTREEIRKDVEAERDLPANERAHLLRALNLHEPVFEFHFPPFDKLGLEF